MTEEEHAAAAAQDAGSSTPPSNPQKPYPYQIVEEVRSPHPFLDALQHLPLPEHHVPTLAANVIRRASSMMRKSTDRNQPDDQTPEANGHDGIPATEAQSQNRIGPVAEEVPIPAKAGSKASSIKEKVTRSVIRVPRSKAKDKAALPSLYFKNPWPSFRQPGFMDIVKGLSWGIPPDYQEALEESQKKDQSASLDQIEVRKPDFEEKTALKDGKGVQVTWLGHATVLLRLPCIDNDLGRSFNILFDPIFSERCSPSQLAGPIRFTPAPCNVEDLPPIDVVCISHNHYDHLDELTMRGLLKTQESAIHICVPLGSKQWFKDTGFPEEQISELDWWDNIYVRSKSEEGTKRTISVTCTPAQHGCGRAPGDANTALWSSWAIQLFETATITNITLEEAQNRDEDNVKKVRNKLGSSRFIAFFAGDTGLKFSRGSIRKRDRYPTCPAFAEVARRIGAPDLMLLPISVGSSLSYIRSFDPFPGKYSPFPRIGDSLTSSIHMSPEDATEAHRIMTKSAKSVKDAVSVAVHYGTFVADEIQTRADIRALQKACLRQGVAFARAVDGDIYSQDSIIAGNQDGGRFVVTHQGETVEIPIPNQH